MSRPVPRIKWHMLRRRRSDPAFLRENLAAALKARAPCEVDIVFTADGHAFCLHDLTLDRETTGTGWAGERTRREIEALRQRGTDGTVLDSAPLFLDEVAGCVRHGTVVGGGALLPLPARGERVRVRGRSQGLALPTASSSDGAARRRSEDLWGVREANAPEVLGSAAPSEDDGAQASRPSPQPSPRRRVEGAGLVQLDIKAPPESLSGEALGRLREALDGIAPLFIAGGADWPMIERLAGAAPGLLAGFDPLALYPRSCRLDREGFSALAEATAATARGAAMVYLEAKLVLAGLDAGVNLVERAARDGAEVDVWTIDADRPDLRRVLARVIEAGCHQITSNDPEALSPLVEEIAA